MGKQSKKLILMRHGESLWNNLGVFTGWVDVPLSQKGIEEALSAGKKIKTIPIDVIFTSALERAQMTTFLAMLSHESKKTPILIHRGEGKMDEWGKIHSKEMEKEIIPVFASWHLNERMYGELQGENKEAISKKYGKEILKTWRRSFCGVPPGGESLEMTQKRTLPYFKKEISPYLEEGKTVFICAHGNSLRSIIMELEGLSQEEIIELELQTGEPIFYCYEGEKWRRVAALT